MVEGINKQKEVNMPYSTCGKSIVDVVKGNGADWVNLLNIVFSLWHLKVYFFLDRGLGSK